MLLRLVILPSLLLGWVPSACGDENPGRSEEERRLKSAMKEEVHFERYLFPVGAFPAASWLHPDSVALYLGKAELSLSFYDEKFRPVVKAEKPGRYGAVIRTTSKDGFKIHRFTTLYALDSPFYEWHRAARSETGPCGEKWNKYQRQEACRFLADTTRGPVDRDPEAAIFFAGLRSMKKNSFPNDSPRVRDRQWWIDFKRFVLGYAPAGKKLKLPARGGKSVTLVQVDPLRAGFQQGAIDSIQAICAEWAEKSGQPHVTLIAHEGAIFFHEAFGRLESGLPAGLESRMWMASITKLLTGILMMQFVDQGLVDLEKPVLSYLPEVPSGAPELHVRDLFTHTAGFHWHDEWASDWNMSLENQLAHCRHVCRVGERLKYNRMGYAVAGKIMERLSGSSVPRLFAVQLLAPLGMKQTFVDNTYGSCMSTAYDIALVGQMLLNRGKYGSKQFFSEESLKLMLPRAIQGVHGRLIPDWGIGTVWLGGCGWSPLTFGHEAASGALLRIDPESRMILVQGRNSTGPDYDQYEKFRDRLLMAAAHAASSRTGMAK